VKGGDVSGSYTRILQVDHDGNLEKVLIFRMCNSKQAEVSRTLNRDVQDAIFIIILFLGLGGILV
jgi:hypothetical protein